MLLDTRCYECAVVNDITDEIGTIAERTYEGNGKFKCPNCKHVLDLSEVTFTIEISRVYDTDGSLITEYTKLDERIKPEDSEGFKDDIDELFDDLPFGKYRCEVFREWSKFGYEGEWDIGTELFYEEDITDEPKWTPKKVKKRLQEIIDAIKTGKEINVSEEEIRELQHFFNEKSAPYLTAAWRELKAMEAKKRIKWKGKPLSWDE